MHVGLNNLISVLELLVHSGIRKYIAGAELIKVNQSMDGLPIQPWSKCLLTCVNFNPQISKVTVN